MGLFKRSSGGKEKGKQPKFVRKEREGNNTYEIYEGTDAESARDFLLTKKVKKRLYYIVVETQEGNWGMDVEGLYLERLLPWQTEISSAKCEGHIIPVSWNMFGLKMAAKGFNDNFIVRVQCGKCEYQWLDGLRYQGTTVVRCPKCKTLNKVDSSSIQVVLV
jgi:ssDNA-binding Zn-finger/Zn-ribbon topoisomerase 1